MNQQDDKFEQNVLNIVRDYMKSSAFTDRKLTDVPTDALGVVNRQYVTKSGTFASRPVAIKGQRYFVTDLATNGKPSWYNGTNWVDATGSVLGAGV